MEPAQLLRTVEALKAAGRHQDAAELAIAEAFRPELYSAHGAARIATLKKDLTAVAQYNVKTLTRQDKRRQLDQAKSRRWAELRTQR